MALLTPRELECLYWVAIGKTSWEIGHIIGVTERTVNFHIRRVCEKLGVARRQAAVTIALQHGLLPVLQHAKLRTDAGIEQERHASIAGSI